VFTNVFLADELQNAQPRTQTAVLDAMMDGAVNALGRAWRLEPPFFVVAAQNPDASTSTALSDAQLDRFMFSGDIGYPSEADETQIAKSPAPSSVAKLGAVFSHKEIALLQSAVADIPVCEHLVHYAVRLVRATRPGDEHAPGIVTKYVERGAGPRAAHHLVTAAKAAAVLTGRLHVTAADIRAVAQPVLRHRIDLNSAAKPAGVNGDAIVQCLLIEFPEPEE
jgi:MoxR-like ATPase